MSTVLVVGDALRLRNVIKALEPWHRLSTAASPRIALEQLSRGERYDMLVLDLGADPRDGVTAAQLLEWLRLHHPETRRITLSSHTPRPRELELSEGVVREGDGAAERVRRLVSRW